MSNGHTVVNEFLKDKMRFADFFNGSLFQGQQIAMPVRGILYDSLSYLEQIKQIWELHRDDKQAQLSGEEYLSRFRKDDKLHESGTLCDELLQKYVSNYRLNLIDANCIEKLYGRAWRLFANRQRQSAYLQTLIYMI